PPSGSTIERRVNPSPTGPSNRILVPSGPRWESERAMLSRTRRLPSASGPPSSRARPARPHMRHLGRTLGWARGATPAETDVAPPALAQRRKYSPEPDLLGRGLRVLPH